MEALRCPCAPDEGVQVLAMGRETRGTLRFAAQPLPCGQGALGGHGLQADPGTAVLVESNQVFLRSDAVWRVASYPPWPWRALMFTRAVPCPLRDAACRLATEAKRAS